MTTQLVEHSAPSAEHALLIREHLYEVLNSELFQSCPQPSRLLKHLVESAIANAGVQPKEQLLGIEVFGRSADWDPQTDSIVRVHANRLRHKLAEYYGSAGRHSLVRIDIPKGGYAPDITVAFAALGGIPPRREQSRPETPDLPPPASSTRPFSRRSIFSLGGASTAGFAAAWVSKPAPSPPRVRGAVLQRLTHERGDLTNAAFAPDGTTVVFSARWAGQPSHIYSLRIGQPYSRQLGLPTANLCDVSSKGEILFTLGNGSSGRLASAALGGGPFHEIADNVVDAVWLPDDRSIAAARLDGGTIGVEFPIGKRVHTFGVAPNRVSLTAHPDGRRVAFADNSTGPVNFYTADIGGRVRRVSSGWRLAGGVRWLPPLNRLVISGARRGSPALHLLDLDSNGSEESFYSTPVTWNLYDCLPSGRLLASCVDSRLHIARGRANSRSEEYFSAVANCRLVGLTPDGRFSVLSDLLGAGPAGNMPVLLASSVSSPPVRIAEGFSPQLSADGSQVVCIERSASGDSLVVAPVPSGLPRRYSLPKGLRCHAAEFAGPANRFLLHVLGADGRRRSHLFQPDSNRMSPVQGVSYVTLVSPDGMRGIVAEGHEMRLVNLESGEIRKVCRLRPGWAPLRWSAAGNGLFVFEPADEHLSATISHVRVETGERRECVRLQPGDQVGVYLQPWADITPDGSQYAYTFQRDLSDLYVVDGLI